jgi:hypothetical protein
MMLGPVMTLVNGPTIAEAIADPANEITRLVTTQPDDAALVGELFMRILSRPATQSEIDAGLAALKAGGDELGKLQAELSEYETKLATQLTAWEATQVPPSWTTLEPTDLKSSTGATFARQADGSVLVEGPSKVGTYRVTLATELASVTALRLELLADARLPGGGPGRAPNGNLVLTELKATAAAKAEPAKTTPLSFGRATADFAQEGFPVSYAVDGRPKTGWAIHPQVGKDHAAVFEIAGNLNYPGGTQFVLTLDHRYEEQHTIGKFRVLATSAKLPLNTPNVPANIAAVLAVAPEARSDAQKAELLAYYRSIDSEWARLSQAVAAAAEQQKNHRLTGAQDLAWALINSPAFLFNR